VPDEWTDAPDDAADDAAPTGDDALHAQVQARVRASAEDARAQAAGRMAAAARAAEVLRAEIGPTGPSTPPLVATPSVAAPVPAETDAASDPAGDTASADHAQPAWTTAADPIDDPSDDLFAFDAPAPGGGQPSPRVPFGGPAAAISDAYSRPPAHQREPMASGTPIAELRITGIGADLEQRGDQLLVYVDRLEHRDRLGRLRRRMPTSDVAHVEVQKRLTGATLVVQSVAGIDLVLRGARVDAAETVRSTILANLAPARRRGRPTPAPFDEAELLRKLVDLYRAGVLTGIELDAKTEVVARLAREATDASRSATNAAPTAPLQAPAPAVAPPTPASAPADDRIPPRAPTREVADGTEAPTDGPRAHVG
jgi:hypothetical protein